MASADPDYRQIQQALRQVNSELAVPNTDRLPEPAH